MLTSTLPDVVNPISVVDCAELEELIELPSLAVQTWAEALRDPQLHGHARARYRDALDHIAELAACWRDAGNIPPGADTKAVAATVLSLMYGLIVMHHLVEDVPADVLLRGVSSLGAATDNSRIGGSRHIGESTA